MSATSRDIKSVAADSNGLLGALAGRAAARIFLAEPPLEIVTTEANIAEVEEYLPEFAERYELELSNLVAALAVIPVVRYSESDYMSHMRQARKLLEHRDADDVHLAALALKLGVPVWSNDDDYDDFPTGRLTTAELIKALGV